MKKNNIFSIIKLEVIKIKENKTVLITGSAKGIGKALINKFAENGYNVIINYNKSKKKALELGHYIKEKYKVKVLTIKCDITNEEEIINMKNIIIDSYKKIDILINNASLARDNYIFDKTKEEFMKVLETNVVGTFLVTKHLNKYITKAIINISSTDAVNTYNDISMDYAASKAAINSLTKTFSLAFKNIKVISVMPNWTNTEAIKEMNEEFLKNELKRIGQKRLYEPEEVANNIYNVVNDENINSGDIVEV